MIVPSANGNYPLSTNWLKPYWAPLLHAYVNEWKIFVCPSDTTPLQVEAYSDGNPLSYIANYYLHRQGNTAIPVLKITKCGTPSQTKRVVWS